MILPFIEFFWRFSWYFSLPVLALIFYEFGHWFWFHLGTHLASSSMFSHDRFFYVFGNGIYIEFWSKMAPKSIRLEQHFRHLIATLLRILPPFTLVRPASAQNNCFQLFSQNAKNPSKLVTFTVVRPTSAPKPFLHFDRTKPTVEKLIVRTLKGLILDNCCSLSLPFDVPLAPFGLCWVIVLIHFEFPAVIFIFRNRNWIYEDGGRRTTATTTTDDGRRRTTTTTDNRQRTTDNT